MVRILYIGDVVGKPGRRVLKEKLPGVIDREHVDFTIVNVENAAGGFGVTGAILEELDHLGVNVYTTGNHVWDKKEFVDTMDEYDRLVRPANYPEGNPGRGVVVRETAAGIPVAVVQLMGQVFMPPCGNPFHTATDLLRALDRDVKIIVVDMHCEATSEKQAMGRHLDGKVSMVVGTHTHVPTADDRILPKGTAYQTDVGMTGAYDGIIGFREEEILHRFLMNTPSRMEVASRDVRMLGALVDADESTGKASSIRRVEVRLDD